MSLFGKSPAEMVYDLIVAKNPKMTKLGVTLDKLIFGTPSHIGAADATDEEKYGRLNATVVVKGDTSKNVIGTVEVTYRRIYVDHLFDGRVVSVDGTKVTTPNDILGLLEAKYGMVIPQSDVKSITKGDDDALIIFNGSSLAWIGRLTVYLTDMAEDTTDLKQIIQTTELEGMAYEESAPDDAAV